MSEMKHNTIKQLLRTPAPQADESLMGYILRLSETNYYETPKWILDLAGLKMYSLEKGWRKLCDDGVDFTLFKQIAKLTEEEVNEMKHEFISNSDYEKCHAQWQVPISSLRFDRPMVCPDCLRENPYCRKFWDLWVVTVCPRHHSLLLDICPSCRKPIRWDRKSVSRCSCGCDWRETKSPELPPAQRRSMRLLMRSCGVSENEQATMGTSATPFEQLGFGDLSRVMLCLVHFASVCAPGMDPLRMGNRLFHQALEEVAAILDDWPEKFHRICDQYPDRYRSDLASHLDRLADRPSLMFLRIAMEEHCIAEEHWIADRRSSSLYDLFPSRRFIPMEKVGERMGLSKEWVNLLVSTGRLRSAASVSDPQTTLIDIKSIDNLFRARRRMISTKMAAGDLGISIETLVDLYQSIERISSPASETAIDLLSQGDSAELMNFDDVREQLQAKNLSLGLWLQAVIEGEVATFKLRPRFIYDIENIHLAHFAFRRDQIREYLSRSGSTSRNSYR